MSETFLVDVCDSADDKYRFGFNNQEKINEISGIGNHNTAEFWEYDTRLGRRWNLDPVDQVSISNYAAFANNPIWLNDIKGDNPVIALAPGVIAGIAASSVYLYYVYNSYYNNKSIDWDAASDAFLETFSSITSWFSSGSNNGAFTEPNIVDGFSGYRPTIIPQPLEMSTSNVKSFPIARVITGEQVKRESKKGFYYVLYQMDDGEGNVYVGRTSGFGTPNDIVQIRVNNHHMVKDHGLNKKSVIPLLAFESTAGSYKNRNIDLSYYGIRAAEDIYIKGYQKIGKSVNERAGISEKNKKRNRYYETYDTYLGNDNLIRDKDNCVNCGSDPTTPLFKN